MNKKIIVGIILITLIVVGISLAVKKTTTSNEVIHTELIPKYPALKANVYLQSKPRFAELETEVEICEEQSFIPYLNRSLKDSRSVNGNWQNVSVIDCGSTYYIGDIDNNDSKLYGPFDSPK